MHKRILVTGAQGFLGRYLIAYLLKNHNDVEILGLGRSPRLPFDFTHTLVWGASTLPAPLPHELTKLLDSQRYRYQSLDICQQPDLTKLIAAFQPQLIYHMASGLRDAPAEHLFRTNVEGTIHLIEAIVQSRIEPPRLIFGSTGYLYGQLPPSAMPIREDAPCTPVDLYGVSKLAAEHAARILTKRYSYEGMWVRIFNLVGPGQEERHFCGRMASQAAAIAAGVQPAIISVGPLLSTRDFLDVRDAATALELIAQRGTPGETYNLGSGIESAVDEVFHSILSLAGVADRVQIDSLPPRSADIRRYVADISKLKGLGFCLDYPLRASLSDLIGYYRGPVALAAAASVSTHATTS